MTKKRCFAAIKIPAFLQYQERLRRLTHDLDVKVSITSSEIYHFTLHFFGDIDKLEQETAIQSLKSIEFNQFELSLKSPGTLPSNPKKTRVLYIHANQGRDKLIDLTMNIRSKLRQVGFSVEKRAFKPHLTVGKVRRGKDIVKLYDRWLAQDFQEKSLTIEEISLIHSDLSYRPPQYSDIATFKLTPSEE